MKKILLIGMSSSKGGIETYLMNIFNELEGQKFQFDFIEQSNHHIQYYSKIIKKGGRVLKANINTSFIGHLNRYNVAYSFFLKHHDYDVVHLNAVTINVLFWLKAANRFNIHTLIIQSHNSGIKRNSLLVSVLSYLFSVYNKIYLHCHPNIIKLAASTSCGKWMFGNNTKFVVINNGINSKYYKFNNNLRLFVRNRLGISNTSYMFVTTARLEPQKNYSKILNVFYHIHNIHKNSFLFIAGNGSLLDKIKNKINTLGLSKSIYLLGSINPNDIKKILCASDLMLMPSYFEAVPYSLTEAQASGVPALVSTNIPQEANITRQVYYLSLKNSDDIWAHKAIYILNNIYNRSLKYKMNNLVRESPYDIHRSISKIKDVYLYK